MNAPPVRHIPALFLGTALTFGGALPLFNAAYALSEFGFPSRIANSPQAQAVFIVSGARTSAIGLAIYILYGRGMLRAVDVVLAAVGTTGLIDGWVCWREGVAGRGVFRATSAAVVAVWGWMGMTAA
ncbi:hypothetical protein Dda_0234 [Drechslerella dactyloides]|uniref:Uncharacterized protein n=1 Tax=Drechslerella dactyloides TaxID=74499 RepID=A0AAD6J5E0_DREDA|nr:hypothetical protein Dda_0234 [Drechslerella dactyloides]